MRSIVVLCASALLAGCTTTNVGTDRLAAQDPLEGFNRGVWGLNRGVDTVLIKPVSTVYRTITPRPARRGLSRILANLQEPWSMINNLLQGNGKRAGRNLKRFLINSTIGVGGLADQATKMGIPAADEDFGQTMAAWGMNGGPYLVLPILGPSTMRDGVGYAAGFAANPYRVGLRESGLSKTTQWAINGFEVVSARTELTESGADAFLESSLDPYASARSAYLQSRRATILNGDDNPDAVPAESDDSVDPILTEEAPAADAAAPAPAAPAPPEAAPAPVPAPAADGAAPAPAPVAGAADGATPPAN